MAKKTNEAVKKKRVMTRKYGYTIEEWDKLSSLQQAREIDFAQRKRELARWKNMDRTKIEKSYDGLDEDNTAKIVYDIKKKIFEFIWMDLSGEIRSRLPRSEFAGIRNHSLKVERTNKLRNEGFRILKNYSTAYNGKVILHVDQRIVPYAGNVEFNPRNITYQYGKKIFKYTKERMAQFAKSLAKENIEVEIHE